MRVSFDSDEMATCCGIEEIGFFRMVDPVDGVPSINQAGAGLYVAAFINTPACHAGYQELCVRKELLWQSELRTNSNTGRELFLAVFVEPIRPVQRRGERLPV